MEAPQHPDDEAQRLQRRINELSEENEALKRDLVDRVRSEDDRRADELGIRLVIDGIPALVIVLSSSGQVDRVNQPALDFFGRTVEEISASSADELVHPHDAGRVQEAFASSWGLGKQFEVELRLRRFDDAYPWFLARALPIKDKDGRIRSWYVLMSDIDETKRAEDRSRARELGARLLVDGLDNIPALAIVANEVGEIVFANRQVLDYYGRTLADVRDWPTSVHVVHPDDLDHANKVVAAALRAGTPCQDEYRLKRRDGVYRWFEGRYSPVRDASGRITNWYVLLIDIEDRKRSEDKLRESEARLAADEASLRRANRFLNEAQRVSRTGSFIWDLHADEHTWSDEVYRIYGLDPGGKVSLELIRAKIHPDDMAEVERVIGGAAEGRDFDFGFRIVTPDGRLKHAHVVAHRIEEIADRPVFLGALQDVTEARVVEENLSRARSELAHVARVAALSATTASIAHEVTQPLSGILTNANTSLRMLATEPPNVAGAAETARRTIRDATRATDVIKRLRDMFSNKGPITELIDLNTATRDVIAIAAGELQTRSARLQTDLADRLPPVSADRVQLQQVILNLLLNAADAMEGIADRPRSVLVRTELEGADAVRLDVRDAGTGFDPAIAEKLFEPFHTTKANGMGIGLSICRSIIESHRGRLWATTNDGPGATFSFSIPAASEPADVLPR